MHLLLVPTTADVVPLACLACGTRANLPATHVTTWARTHRWPVWLNTPDWQ